MEKRKIIKVSGGRYQLLKPRQDGNGWNKYGKKKSLLALANLFDKNEFELYMSEEIVSEIGKYRRHREEKKKEYCSGRALESKTI